MKQIEKQTAAIKARMLSQLEWMCEQAAIGWERSLEQSEATRTTSEPRGSAVEGGKPVATEIVETVKGQSGNPAFLREARAALAEIRDILGMDKPEAAENAVEALLLEAEVQSLGEATTQADPPHPRSLP